MPWPRCRLRDTAKIAHYETANDMIMDLPQVFLNIQQYDTERVFWLTIIHMAFVVSALLMAFLERLMSGKPDQ